MVDHCPAEKLLEPFLEFVDKVKLQLQLMLHLFMDGTNVNLRFQELLNASSEMKNFNRSILSIGTLIGTFDWSIPHRSQLSQQE